MLRDSNLLFKSSQGICLSILALILAACSPQVATSFWVISTPAYSDMPGYRIIQAEGQTRHCYPVTAWVDGPEEDTYHQLHHHGVAVESKLMAYRIYFDKKQTIDVYCKRHPQLELATSFWYPNDSLLAAGYGDDILRVSGTVGVGTVKYWNDKLYHIEEVGERQQWILKQTPRSATIGVSDIDWTVPDGRQDAPETRQMANLSASYTMRAGHRDMRCDVEVSEPIEGLCTGVQLLPTGGHLIEETKDGVLLGSWGTDWPVNDSVKYGKETVGLGVFIPRQYAGKTVQDKRNSLCLLKPSAVSRQYREVYVAHFYLVVVGATKEDAPPATDEASFYRYLRRWAKKLR